ncbi:hypothetical protein C8R34_12446 [Nitrosomonas sp. Nm84]|uniref:hypothetical protein n=1 Tax=Nitrosomonas sp. Nm84 TaxID=200124 RepID=UPI000D76816F|nr:hypothetical protein [Nitrosomonas sp. Nm84]PXW84753.1 hypothetical protein C8R34_12446 [Nitrosomonas sp. Nm84]
MASSRSTEIRLWWPLPLAALVWLLIIWGVGFLLSLPEVEPLTPPPPIAASFIDLNETENAKNSLPAASQSAPTPPQEQPKVVEEVRPAPKLPPLPAQSPPSRSQPKPKAVEKPSKPTPTKPAKEKIVTKVPPKAAPDAPTDLSEYINQAKARRRAEGLFDNEDSAAASTAAPQPSADEIRMANVRRNLQAPGTSGIFQILRIGPRTAEFSFRAWTTGESNPRLQTIQVDAGQGGNVERAIIRRMIELIRQYYKEDFNWESHRLHRVVVLSAREKDSAGLEDFLMREFFVSPVH